VKGENGEPDALATVVALARSVVNWIPLDLREMPLFTGARSASEHRAGVLIGSKVVSLEALLAHTWHAGIPVVHFGRLPRASGELRSLVGFSEFAGQTPVVALGTRKWAEPWLAYHLAHALGHLMRLHVTPERSPLVDAGHRVDDSDPEEVEAEAFARALLLGDEARNIPMPTVEPETALGEIRAWAHKRRVDPAIYALYIGLDTGAWPLVEEIFHVLGQAESGHVKVAGSIAPHLPTVCDNVHDTAMRLIDLVYEA
jgi:hypothetical protein